MESLKNMRPEELSKKLVDMSQKLQEIRLSETRAKRRAEEAEQKENYLYGLLKGKEELLREHEEKTA